MAFYVKNSIKYKPIEFISDIACIIIEVQFADTYSTTICLINRSETLRLNQLFPKLEKRLHFLNSRSNETVIFGDFNIDILKNDTDRKNYETLLAAYAFELRNFEPIRVATKSKNCIDHFITQNEIVTQTLTTTIRDHYTVLATIPVTVTESKMCEKNDITRYLNNLRGDRFLSFLFLLDQKLKSIPHTFPVGEFVSQVIETITFCVEIIAPEKNPSIRKALSIRNENQ